MVSAAPFVLPVILSGGAGARLWPLSTPGAPKQFHALAGQTTLIQDTALRLSGAAPVRFLPPAVICGATHGALVRRQLAEVGVEPSVVVLEPVGRNTAAAAAIAARLGAAMHPEALVLLAPADHAIIDPDGFRAAVARGAAEARGRIVTFGIAPTGPETGYGYIQQGVEIAGGVHEIARFAEKPDRSTAQAWLAQGGYVWNGGIFLFAPQVLLEELEAFRPDILAAADAALSAARGDAGALMLDPALFEACPSAPIDVAVMERTRKAAVVPVEVGWADLGSWSEIWRRGASDAAGNVVRGAAVVEDSRGALVWGEGTTVAVLGMEDVVVVAAGGAVLVAPRSRAQDIRALVAAAQRLKAGDTV